jgi:hypothetical protein
MATAKTKKPAAKLPAKSSSASKTSTATKTATATKTSTDAYTQGNITVTGGAGRGPTNVKIGLPGGSLANNAKKATKAKASK